MQRLLEPKQVVLSEDGVTVPEPVAQRRRNPRPSPAPFDLGQMLSGLLYPWGKADPKDLPVVFQL